VTNNGDNAPHWINVEEMHNTTMTKVQNKLETMENPNPLSICSHHGWVVSSWDWVLVVTILHSESLSLASILDPSTSTTTAI
jgi:hypothetical protein